ncbi:hypothetical protein WJX74_001651 [Apatococcus lobatus]|uniref:LIM zinc-binding domain-containing protein n=1 Tax=Apatococcus lobatus TaxID=904363 RepID=A0AAW1QAL7_9CHLO
MFSRKTRSSLTNGSGASQPRTAGQDLSGDAELAKRLQDEEIARAQGHTPSQHSSSAAGQASRSSHDADLAAAMKQSTLEASSSNYSHRNSHGGGPSHYHTFPNGAESSLPASRHSPYPSYPPSSQPYPQVASSYAPGGPSHMPQNNQRHAANHPNPDQKFEDDLQLAMAMSASEAKIEQQRQDLFQSKQLQAMQQYRRDQHAQRPAEQPSGSSRQQPHATGQRPHWQERISSRLKSFPSGHAPSAPPIQSPSPAVASAVPSFSTPDLPPLFPSLTTASPNTQQSPSKPPARSSLVRPSNHNQRTAGVHANGWREDLHGPADPFDLLLEREQAGIASQALNGGSGHTGYPIVDLQAGQPTANGRPQGGNEKSGLQSSPSLLDDWPIGPPPHPSTRNDESLARSLQLDEDLSSALQSQTPGSSQPFPSQPPEGNPFSSFQAPSAGTASNHHGLHAPTAGGSANGSASGWNPFHAQAGGPQAGVSSSGSGQQASQPPSQKGPFTTSGRFSPPVSLPSSSSGKRSGSPAPPSNKDSCAGCGKGLGLWGLFPTSEHIVALGQKWHPTCFKCPLCAQSIAHGTFAIGNDHRAYHVHCHKQAFHPCCSVCQGFLPVEKDNRVVFLENRFWHERYCPKHQKDGTHRCTACSRLQPVGQDWTSLQDGRALCHDCLGTMVLDTPACQPLYTEIISFFAGMGMTLPENPPLMLVESSALNEVAEGRLGPGPAAGSNSSSAGATFHTRGLTMTEHHRTITTVVRGGGPFNVVPQVTRTQGPERCTVTAILVLYGLPRLLTGSILAHEVMHAWLRMHGCTHLGPKEEEGLCQLVALLWLERQDPASLKGKWDERLASYLGHQIRTDPSPTYGDGLRAALESFQQRGLPATVDAVQKLRRFP